MNHKKYNEYFKDNINKNIGAKKIRCIFNSRKVNQDKLFSFGSNINGNFASSPFGENLENQMEKLQFTLQNNNLNKDLLDFSKVNKSFEQFLNKKSNSHPRVFKKEIHSDNRYYDFYLNNINWDKLIELHFYSDKNVFEIWVVVNGDFFDIYLNKCCILSDVYSVNSLNNEVDFFNLCTKMNVNKSDLLNFIDEFIF